jgi:predicted acyl esterase
VSAIARLLALASLAGSALAQNAQTSPPATGLPSDIPAAFTRVTASFDYVKRDVMIPMRNGVRLRTVILVQQRKERTGKT